MAYSPKPFEEYFLNVVSYLVSKNSKITNFKPGSRVRTLVEAICLELAKLGYEFASGYKDSIRESCYESFDFSKLPAEKSAGFLRIEKTGHTSDIAIPVFQITEQGLTYETTAASVLPVGSTFVDVDMLAVTAGSDHNLDAFAFDSDEGRGNILLAEEFDYDRVYNPANVTGGTDGETDAERAARFSDFIKSFYRATLNGIRYAVRTTPGVKDYYVFDNIDPVTSAENPGWINILLSDGTNSVSESVIQAVRDKVNGITGDPVLTGYRAAGTQLFVGKLQIQPVNVFYELDVKSDTDYTDTILKRQVETAIINYVNGLKNSQDVLLDSVRAFGLTANPDIIKIRILGMTGDISVKTGYVPKIGGSGGGSIICNSITRILV